MPSVKTTRLSSLGLKVLAAYVIGALVSIAAAVGGAVWMVRQDVLADFELSDRARELVKKVRFDATGRPSELDSSDPELDWLYDSLPREAAYRVMDATGQVVLVSKADTDFWPSAMGGPRLGRSSFFFRRHGVTLYGATEVFEHDGRRWVLQFATSERLMRLIQHKYALPYMGIGIGVFSAALIVAFGLFAYLTLRYALRPLRGVSEAAAAISPRSLHERLRMDGVPGEISPLVESFNRVLERLEHGYRLQQEFLANAAHELKTPLALIRAQIEVPSDAAKAREAVLGDIDYMTRQVQQLLLLAEASESTNYRFADLSVRDVVHEVVGFLRRVANQSEVRLTIFEPAETVVWRADRGALFTLLKNLLENAIEHSPPSKSVGIELRRTEILVRDVGPGVAPEDLPKLFQRFWRGAHRQDQGAGLGLAICREIALAHGWRLDAEPAEPGLRLRLTNDASPLPHP